VLEMVARVPCFAYLSALDITETFGEWYQPKRLGFVLCTFFLKNNQLLQMLSWEKGKALSCFGGLLIVDKKEMLGATEWYFQSRLTPFSYFWSGKQECIFFLFIPRVWLGGNLVQQW
jgi:hypothetical protein